MKIVLSTRNKHKICELQKLLSLFVSGIEIISLDDIGFNGEIEENGNSFEENAMIKARAAAEASGLPAIADDSGLTVEALDGAPGIFSARYSGVDGDGKDEANNNFLLKNLYGISNRTATFVCAIACVFPGNEENTFVVTGKTEGEILCAPRGENGFGYDPLFWYDELGKSFAEMTSDEKNIFGHRGKAVVQLADRLQKIIDKENK